MAYTDQEIHQIITLREAGTSWDLIGALVHKKPGALCQWWSQYQKIKRLPPKQKFNKSITSGRIGLQIKKLHQDNPQLTIRDTEVELRKVFGPETRIPKPTTIFNYLQNNNMVMIRLLRKPLVSDKNKLKRVQFAEQQLNNLDKLIHETNLVG
jgi:hypothetical protein